MNKFNLTRRSFLYSSAATIASLFSGRIFAAPPGWKHEGKPNLIFGVLSDTHLRTRRVGNKLGANWTDKYFISALTYFKSINVDGIMHCGDFAHRGQIQDMAFHARAWRKVFPKDAEPVKLFVTGNHDTDGAKYGEFVNKRYPDPVERAKHVLSTDMAANWQKIWGEKYEPIWHKEVKGYHFFGQNHAVPDTEAIAYIKKCGKEFSLDKGNKPFFFVRHTRPNVHIRKKALLPLRNSISFFGHNHWSIANWNIPSVYYKKLPLIQCASCEPRGCRALVGDQYITKAKLERNDTNGSSRQGYVVKVYDDMLVIERHEFTNGESSLGADWIMPLGKNTPHPLSREELKKVIGNPQFRKEAKLEIAFIDESNLQIKIPCADGNPNSRIYAYEIEVTGEQKTPKDNTKLLKAVYAAGVNMGIAHKINDGMTTLKIKKDELPPGEKLSFKVHPLTSLGTRGNPIVAEFNTGEIKTVKAATL
jgi:predicted phosphodiesterase